jgi:hypothetical protein
MSGDQSQLGFELELCCGFPFSIGRDLVHLPSAEGPTTFRERNRLPKTPDESIAEQ